MQLEQVQLSKYTLLEEDWGEEEDLVDEDGAEDEIVNVQPTMPPHEILSRSTKTSSITDYFPSLRIKKATGRIDTNTERIQCKRKRKRMDSELVALWDEPEDGMGWFEDQTAKVADLINPKGRQRMRMEDEDGIKAFGDEDRNQA